MADTRSGFRKALEASLITDEDKRFVGGFYDSGMPVERLRGFAAERWQNLANHANDPDLWLSDRFPKDFQVDAIKAHAAHMADPAKPSRGYTAIPMGGGKTFLFSHLIDALSNRQGRSNKQRVAPPTIVLVPTEQLVEQTVGELQAECPGLEVGKYYGKEKAIRPVTVMVYNSFVKAVDEGFIRPEDVGYLFMDEAHRGLSDLRQDIFQRFRDNTVMSAYSATPEFGDDKSIETLFGDRTRIYDISASELIKRGHLSPADNFILHVDVQIDKDAMPEDDKQLRKLTRIARMKAATEFLLTYEDAETGRSLMGETTLGFNHRSDRADDPSSASGTAKYLNQEVERRARFNPELARQIAEFDHVAEFVGSANPDSLNVVQRLKEGKTMASFSVKFGREGTDIPRATVLLNIQGSNSRVDTMQGDGRVLRKWDENPMKRAAIVDFFTTVNGRPTQDYKPLFFHEVIHDDSVVKDFVTTKIHIDKATAEEWLKQPEPVEQKPKRAKPAPQPVAEQEFLDQRSFAREVLGEGSAAIKYRSAFNHVWDRMNEHYRAQIHQEQPVPLIVGGRSLQARMLPVGLNKKIEFEVGSGAVEAFRQHIHFPQAKTSEQLDKQELKQAVLGDGAVAKAYEQAFEQLWKEYHHHYEANAFKVSASAVMRGVEPFVDGDLSIPYKECIDENGDLLLTTPRYSVGTFRDMLGMPRDKTSSWLNEAELQKRVFEFSEVPEVHQAEFDRLWAAIQAKGRAQNSGHTARLEYDGQTIPLARCVDKGEETVCVMTRGVRAIQKALNIPRAAWAVEGDEVEPGQPHQYSAELVDIASIRALRDGQIPAISDLQHNQGVRDLPQKTDEWLYREEVFKELGFNIQNSYANQIWQAMTHAFTEPEKQLSYKGNALRCQRVQPKNSRSNHSVVCLHKDDLSRFWALVPPNRSPKKGDGILFNDIRALVPEEFQSKLSNMKDVLVSRMVMERRNLIDCDDHQTYVQRVQTGASNEPQIAIDSYAIPNVFEVFDINLSKTQKEELKKDFLTLPEMAAEIEDMLIGGISILEYNRLRSIFRDKNVHLQTDGLHVSSSLPDVDAKYVWDGEQVALGIHQSNAVRLAKAIGALGGPSLGPEQFLHTKKSIHPDSEHIRDRSGRGRDATGG